MNLTLDPMPMLRTNATQRINEHFNREHLANAHRDQAHAHKFAIAQRTLAGKATPPEFVAEAKLRGVTLKALARTIVDKAAVGDASAARELNRQRLLLQIDAATTPAEIDAALAAIGIPAKA